MKTDLDAESGEWCRRDAWVLQSIVYAGRRGKLAD
jgi:hypothetical protein